MVFVVSQQDHNCQIYYFCPIDTERRKRKITVRGAASASTGARCADPGPVEHPRGHFAGRRPIRLRRGSAFRLLEPARTGECGEDRLHPVHARLHGQKPRDDSTGLRLSCHELAAHTRESRISTECRCVFLISPQTDSTVFANVPGCPFQGRDRSFSPLAEQRLCLGNDPQEVLSVSFVN